MKGRFARALIMRLLESLNELILSVHDRIAKHDQTK